MPTLSTRVLVQLRDMILKGEFAPGERLTEIPLAERMNASRTPVRAALVALQQEGLVELAPGGGFMMRQITRREVDNAIKVRGHLEGLAARLIAENGITRQLSQDLHNCLRLGDTVVAKPTLSIDDYAAYTQMNDRFHTLICEGAANFALKRCIEQISQMPFAAASALVPSPASVVRGKEWLLIAHHQHRMLVEAMERNESARAQAIAEEHVNISRQNLEFIFTNDTVLFKGTAGSRTVVAS